MNKLESFLSQSIISVKHFNLTVSSLVAMVLLILVVWGVKKGFQYLVHRAFVKRGKLDTGREYTIVTIFNYVLYTISILIGLELVGVDITVLIGASAALMVGIGLGLQDTFKDIFSGFVLLLEGVFKVGDVIEFEGTVCKVLRIDLRTSMVETRDGTVIIVPNGNLVNGNIINWSLNHADTRFYISVGVAYGSDTQLVTEILEKITKAHPDVTKKDRLFVKFADFGDSALMFEVYFWTRKQWDIERIKSKLRYEIDEAFRVNKISIPFPQRDLHIIRN